MRNYKEHLIATGSTVREALVKLDVLAKDAILFVVDDGERLIGSLTDGDVRRGLLKGKSIDSVVDDFIQKTPRFIEKGENNIQKIIDYREGNFKIIPIIDKDKTVLTVINFREIQSYLPVDAVIMAGGRGQRLMPLTKDTPKPMLIIGEKPIIEHNIDRLIEYGVSNVFISINYLGHIIENHFENGAAKGIKIQYITEDAPLGTFGAVTLVEHYENDYILLMNSDLLTTINFEDFFNSFVRADADMAVAAVPYYVDIPYAVLETGDDDRVLSLQEKPRYTYYSNAGIYLFKKELLEHIPKNEFYNATDLMEFVINSNKKLINFPILSYWLDIGKMPDYTKAQEDIKHLNL